MVYLKHFVRFLSRQLQEKRYREIVPLRKMSILLTDCHTLLWISSSDNFGVHQKVFCAITVKLQYSDDLRPEGNWARDNKVLEVLASIHLNSDWIVSLGNRLVASTRICRNRNITWYYFLCITNFSNGGLFSQLGIVGRTGSGKSSLFQVLFRMVNSYQGAVLLDGVNLASVPLDILRLVSTGLCPYGHCTIAEKEFIKSRHERTCLTMLKIRRP